MVVMEIFTLELARERSSSFFSVKRALKRLHFSSAQRQCTLARSLFCSFHLFVNDQGIVQYSTYASFSFIF